MSYDKKINTFLKILFYFIVFLFKLLLLYIIQMNLKTGSA